MCDTSSHASSVNTSTPVTLAAVTSSAEHPTLHSVPASSAAGLGFGLATFLACLVCRYTDCCHYIFSALTLFVTWEAWRQFSNSICKRHCLWFSCLQYFCSMAEMYHEACGTQLKRVLLLGWSNNFFHIGFGYNGSTASVCCIPSLRVSTTLVSTELELYWTCLVWHQLIDCRYQTTSRLWIELRLFNHTFDAWPVQSHHITLP